MEVEHTLPLGEVVGVEEDGKLVEGEEEASEHYSSPANNICVGYIWVYISSSIAVNTLLP